MNIGRTGDEVMRDIDRDRFMTAAEGVEYGLIDEVMAQPARSLRST